jgi:hypothetical protein
VTHKNINPVTISNFINSQFPLDFRENQPELVNFVKSYYEFLELPGNPLYLTRRLYDIKDIDYTLDEFLVHFKSKYLVDIEFDTKTNIRQVVKHALDLYRSKGTPRELNLLFQLVYGEDIEIYYPSEDLFRTSDGNWFLPTYIELTPSEVNVQLYQKEVRGNDSGAVAFIDDIIRKIVKGAVTDVAYISALSGNFKSGEKIIPVDRSLLTALCPSMIGSMTSIELPPGGTGANYSIGDMVTFTSTYGDNGLLRVANVASQAGVIDFTLLDGGYGFTANADFALSTVDFRVSNVTFSNTYARNFVDFNDVVTQRIVYLNYTDANGYFTPQMNVSTYNGDNSLRGTGIIIAVNQANTSAGTLTALEVSGTLNNTFYTSSNTISAQLALSNGYFQATATGNFVANSTYVILTVPNANSFSVGEVVTGDPVPYYPAPGQITGTITAIGPDTITVSDITGYFTPGSRFKGTSGTSANVVSVSLQIGVRNVVNEFFGAPGMFVSTQNITGYIDFISKGLGASFGMTGLTDTETVMYNTDKISDYFDIPGDATAYGFPAFPSGNLTSGGVVSQMLTFAPITIGRVGGMYTKNPGSNYISVPLFRAFEPKIAYNYVDDDEIITLTSASSFTTGERITQQATSARGLVVSQSNNVIKVLKLRYNANNDFVLTTNTTTQIVGIASGTIANAIAVANNAFTYKHEGGNMKSKLELGSTANSVISLEVVDSGIGYIEGEEVILANNNGSAIIHVAQQGRARGFYKQKGGFLSDQKKLFDGDYYQNYSYEIISSLMRDKYSKMVDQVAHVAGTKMFGRFVQRSYDNGVSSVSKTKITVSQ